MTGMILVSLVQMECAPLDVVGNRTKICAIARDEALAGRKLVLFPELATTGYIQPVAPGMALEGTYAEHVARFAGLAEPLDGPTVSELTNIAAQHQMRIVIGLALRDAAVLGKLTNSSVLIGPSGVEAVYHKWHLWQNEKLYFAEGSKLAVVDAGVGGLGMQICYDIRFPELTRALALAGANVVTSIWASFRPYETPPSDPAHFRHRAFTRAQENGVFFLSCNRVGIQSRHRFMGHSVVCAPDGRVLAEAPHEDEAILHAALDLSEVARYRHYTGILNDRRPELYSSLISIRSEPGQIS
ncbi:MAG: carbon-nitrogen hydrolase family protein [Rhodobacteraceae bacterium]|nr:carbon-nitrogen hydrolase family protein [Paracoccaceae bacterium]